MKLFRGILFFALFVVLYPGCKPAPTFPVEPILKFKTTADNPNAGFIQRSGSDSLQVVFSFTDGDGDIGVAPNDTNYNMLLTPYHKNPAGNWVVIDDPNTPSTTDSLTYKYRIPKLTAGQVGLEGDIYVTVSKFILIQVGEDTLQFNAFLLDQAHHKSNVVRTPEVDLIP